MFYFVCNGKAVPTVKVHNSVAQQHPNRDLFPLMCAHAIIAMYGTPGSLLHYDLETYLNRNPELDYLRESFLDNFAGFYTFRLDG